ncbi:energy-coupling factor ABC transporter ATP-binding protein [Diplocloster agilis]|uniref:ABC transporter ATP-binding protein n=1 Tax=Diplocloster agilis TaxID=2850323 RepID=A0A949NAI1_9FIRM|nr:MULTISPECIES: ATP-binding cassette domain-containing protein [Lachnospiraceae]MBU9736502.1 ATP-binding cassette domain-containing protein [Diplocloster agilis]MBU9744354.1 ATP-binding cassette domain-containing protein [Diplocloster agilis]MCU6734993.1 ATP-binding cassette domain-containing protein [Suonthocola fibrivorans]SCJ61260.1 Cobalt import ATP-binding protein CbiO [uncultured Clostridium sp.]
MESRQQEAESSVILEIRDLTYRYETGTQALDGVNLKIRTGERIAVLGANGAGKSTLFLNMNGVLSPDRGEIFLHGEKVNKKNINALRKKVGIVFQDADNQIIASTVLAEVSFGPMNLKLARPEVARMVDEALDYMELNEFRDRPPHYLSGGEKKRVSIADIIAMRPEVIIFDEPTASLDPVNAGMLEEVLEKLGSENKTIIISTHDVDFAYRWAQRVLVVCGGKVLRDGTALEVFSDTETLKKAHLKRPALMDIYELLVEKKLVPDQKKYPRDTENFRDLFE